MDSQCHDFMGSGFETFWPNLSSSALWYIDQMQTLSMKLKSYSENCDVYIYHATCNAWTQLLQ